MSDAATLLVLPRQLSGQPRAGDLGELSPAERKLLLRLRQLRAGGAVDDVLIRLHPLAVCVVGLDETLERVD